MGMDALAHVLRPLATTFAVAPADLLVGLGRADDAAVYRLSGEQAIIATVDFFPPVVDDPYAFGAIAAANALSDVYAMGGEPLFALNLVGWPADLDAAILGEILRGGAEKVREAGAVIAGGHSVIDDEPKYGLAAIGMVRPAQVLTKGGVRSDDVLLLTKPLGTGIITTAGKQEAVSEEHLAAAIASMSALNAPAARVLHSLGADVHACTDVTGYSLLGHAWEMAEQSSVLLRIELASLAWLPGVREYAAAGHVPDGTHRNRDALAAHVRFSDAITDLDRVLLCDPQTSGGLLVAMAPAVAEAALAALAAAGVDARRIGDAMDGEGVAVI
jgi:selenide,water dikinase